MSYKVQRPCRVCGKMYTPCSNCDNDNVSFRWRTVACSVECGMEYFKRIEESRNHNNINKSDDIMPQISNINKGNTYTKDTVAKRKYTKKKNIEESEQIE